MAMIGRDRIGWRPILIGLLAVTSLLVAFGLFVGNDIARLLDPVSLEERRVYRMLDNLERQVQRLEIAALRHQIDPDDRRGLLDLAATDGMQHAFDAFDQLGGFLSPTGGVIGDAAYAELRDHRLALGQMMAGIRAGDWNRFAQQRWRIDAALGTLATVLADGLPGGEWSVVEKQQLRVLIQGTMAVSVLMLMIMWAAWRVTQEAGRTEHMLEAAINAMGKAFIILDDQNRIQLANDEYHELYGFKDKIKPGTPYRDVLRRGLVPISRYDGLSLDLEPDSEEAAFEAIIDYRLDRLKHDHIEWEQELKNGRILIVRDAPMPGGGYVSLRTDVTALKRIEERLRQQLRAMDLTSDGIAVLNAKGHFTFVNQAYARLIGQEDAEAMIGRPWQDYYGEETCERFMAEILPTLYKTTRWNAEVAIERRDGKVIEQDITFDLLPTGEFICISRDVTARRAAEAERDALQQQVYQAQKMEAIGRLAGGIAHDFNNILASVLGYATLLEQDLPRNTDTHHFAESIRISAERAASLVSQILAFSRSREETNQERVDVGSTVDEVVRMLKATLPATISLNTNLADTAPPVRLSQTRLNQVIMNLCVNAGDAMEDRHGQIDISLEVGSAEDIRAITGYDHMAIIPSQQIISTGPDTGRSCVITGDAQHIAPNSPVVILCVRDTGHGIPPDIAARIFEPFFTTKAVDKGTGLGLAAVHGIVMAAGGVLMVDTEPGKGTAFTIILPAAETASDQRSEELPPDLVWPRGAGLVMVVDDDQAIAEYLKALMTRQGYQVLVYTSSEEAIVALADRGVPVPDILITDQTMPGATGLDVIRAARDRSRGIRIILSTGYSEVVDQQTALAAGADYFLKKPVAPALLLDCLEHCMRRPKMSA